jgi:hypothetical protein
MIAIRLALQTEGEQFLDILTFGVLNQIFELFFWHQVGATDETKFGMLIETMG